MTGNAHTYTHVADPLKDDAIISIQTPSRVGSQENLAAESDHKRDEKAGLPSSTENNVGSKPKLEQQPNGTVSVVSGKNLPEVPHRRIGSHAVNTGKQQYDHSPTGKGITSQSGNLYGKKQSAAADTLGGSTSIGGNTTEEVKQMFSGQNSTNNSIMGQAKTLSPAKMVASQNLNSEFVPEVIEEEASLNGGPSL